MASVSESRSSGQPSAARRLLASRGGVGLGDRIFHVIVTALAGGMLALLALLVILLIYDSWPSLTRYGFSFLTSTTWDPVFEKFGAAPYIWGTLVTSAIAVLFAAPIGVGAALFLVEYAPKWLSSPVGYLIELLAVIPSIIFGLWAFFVLAPFMQQNIEPFLKNTFGSVPLVGSLFEGSIVGKDYLVAGMILVIMILPTVMAVSREIIRAVPDTQREGMIALGSTRWEMIRGAVLPYARTGIVGGVMLGLARAFGETMAVTLVIGNSSSKISASLFTPGYTMASAIANQFTEADKEIYFAAIIEVALVLLLVSAVVNTIARLIVWRVARGPVGARI